MLVESHRKTFALLPLAAPSSSGWQTSVARVAEQLGQALAELSHDNVALLSLAPPPAGSSATSFVREGGKGVSARWLSSSLALLVPSPDSPPERGLPALQGLLRCAAPRAPRIIADLSALLDGDANQAIAACHLFDATLLLALAGRTRDADVLRAKRQLHAESVLGAVLVHE
jgi:hypothetical protein